MKTAFAFLFIFTVFNYVTAQQSLPTQFGTTSIQAGFLENRGQVKDFNNKPVEFVYYQANLGGEQVFITKYGLSILLSRPKKIRRIAGLSKSSLVSQNPSPSDSLCIVNYEMERIDIVLKKASILLQNITSTDDPSSPLFNLYLNENATNEQGMWLKNEILIRNVYPGIDWKVYIKKDQGNQPALKYDFIVHPGADVSQVQIRYSDNAKMKLSGSRLTGKVKMGLVNEEKPYSYIKETRDEVNVTYHVEKNTIRFLAADYDKTQTLVIDPSIFWLTYLSSKEQAWKVQSIIGNDIETDSQGNIFVQLSAAGSVPFPTKNPGGGAYYQDYAAAPNGSMIIIKYAPGGQMLWCTYFGNWVAGRCMTIDKSGNIIVIGIELNGTPSNPSPKPSFPLLNNGGYFDNTSKTSFIAKFSNDGLLTWSTWYLNFDSYPIDMSYDVNGNFYVVGRSTIYDFPTVDPGGGAFVVSRPEFGYAQTLFISQFNSTNQLTWSTRIEGRDYDPYARVCTDKQGNIYIGGQVRSDNYPVVDAGGFTSNSGWGSVISRFNPSHQMTWSTYFPGPFSFADLTTDDSSNLYVIADRRILKFNAATELVFEKSLNTTPVHFWQKINYDPYLDQVQMLGVMNDGYWGFPTLNTACNGSFFHDGVTGRQYNNATGPIFATIGHDGEFSYLSLADWPYEYYDRNEMSVDPKGNPVYLFEHNSNGFVAPNPQLTDPGNGAYFDDQCCYLSDNNTSALLLKLSASELSLTTEIIPPTGCISNGSATITARCGKEPFSYRWSNGATTASVNDLGPGNYWVRVTDANNISRTLNIAIPFPPGSISSFSTAITPENCNRSNGQISIQTVIGGTAPYTFSIDGMKYNPSPFFNGLNSGNYIVRVRDANGCIFNDTLEVSVIPGPKSLSFNNVSSSCKADDGVLKINNVQGGVGPYHYSLSNQGSNDSGVFNNLASGFYQLRVIDTAGCLLDSMVVIEKAIAATDVSFNLRNDHCSKSVGYLKVNTVTGGTFPYTYSVDSLKYSTSQISNLAAGNYNLFVKDANGCVFRKGPIVISNEPGPSVIDFAKSQAYCGRISGDVLVNSVQGGAYPYMYSLDDNSFQLSGSFSNIQPGIHKLHVKDVFGCAYSQDFVVDYLPLAQIKLSTSDTSICYDETISLSLTGDVAQARNVSWNIPFQGLGAAIKITEDKQVWVSFEDSNSCIIKDTAIIRVKACSTPDKCVLIPTAFTPNHDGKNEMLTPKLNGCRVESIRFMIYNRWGELVFESNQPNVGWNGLYKGILQPEDVYVYYCSYITDDGVSRQQKGTFILIR